MSDPVLGRLEKVSLRDAWQDEARNFTPWLAKAENLSLLSDALGIELELEATEEYVGRFKADFLCKEQITDAWVLIENQLSKTDHSHLGQLLTYAAGLDATTIVWIAPEFTEEHRAALDHLNDITDDSLRCFGVEVELWRIGSSPPAPKFNLVSKPNDWARSVLRAAKKLSDEPVSELKQQQRRYWEALNVLLNSEYLSISTRKPRPQHWTTFSVGRSGFQISATTKSTSRSLTAEIYIYGEHAKGYFALLEEQQADIEKELGEPLIWELLPDRKACRIALYKRNTDPTDETDWPEQHAWLGKAIVRLDNVFRQRIARLDLDDLQDEADEP